MNKHNIVFETLLEALKKKEKTKILKHLWRGSKRRKNLIVEPKPTEDERARL